MATARTWGRMEGPIELTYRYRYSVGPSDVTSGQTWQHSHSPAQCMSTHHMKIGEHGNRDPRGGRGRRHWLPETFFHGIAGHVWDRHGHRVDGWFQSGAPQRLACCVVSWKPKEMEGHLSRNWPRYFNLADNTYHDYYDCSLISITMI